MKFFLIQNGTNQFIVDTLGFKQMYGEGWYVIDITIAPCARLAASQFADT